MLTDIHITPLYRVVVNVIELLTHHRFIPHKLRMSPFLPDLINPVGLVHGFDKAQTLKRALGIRFLEDVDYLPGSERLETIHTFI